jgi:hypothetical protein
MADVSGKFFSAKKVRTGVSPSSPGVIVGDTLPPVNPPGSSLADYVPYTGATQNVDLGEFGVDAGFVQLDTTPTNTPTSQGTIFWDVDDETVDVVLNGYIMKIGEDQFYPVKNQTGSSIAKGTAVRFAGTVGASGRLLIAPFIANGTVSSSFFMGVTAEAIADGADGKVLYFGRIRGINTNAFNEGDVLYASTTVAGGFQTAVPVAPNNIVQVAAVINKSINQGVIFIRPSFGSNINQDEGVKIVSPTTGQLLQLQANGLWENKTKAQVLGGTSSQFVKGDGSLDSNVYALNSALANYQLTSEKAQPNGYASLDSNGKVPLVQINDALIGNVNFQGLWNAATNTPTLANPPASGTKGYYYIVSTAGTFAGISFEVGDWIISNGTAWGKVDNTDAVSSVFGRTGNVTASNGDYNTSQVTENTNLYFTNARVLATALTGYLVGTNAALAATDTILGAFGKVQGQLNAKQNTLTNPITGTGTNNFLPRFTGTTTIGNSTIQTNSNGDLMVGSADAGDAGSINVSVGIAGSTSGGLQLWSSNLGTHYLQFGYGTTGEQKYAGYVGYSHSTNAMVFGTDSGNRMRIFSDGNVSISNFPSNGGFKLDVNGTGRFIGNLTAASLIRSGGTSAQFLKADGSVDSNTYVTGGPYLPLTGGTLTGTLNGTTAVFSNTVTGNQGIFKDGSSGLIIGYYTGGNGYGAIYASSLTINNSNYALIAKSDNTILNAPTGGSVNVSIGNTPRLTIASTGAATFSSSVTITDGGYYIYDTRTNLANRNWVLVSNAQFFGDFAIRQSNAKDGNPFTAGTDRFYIGATGAASFSSSVTATSIIRSGGTSSQFLKADGSVDSTAYGTGSVTSVAALTIGTTGTNITSTVANGTTTPVITLNIPTASATNRGALSSTDWTTFNNKQNALTNPVTGTGTTNYLPKFTGASTIGNSQIFDNGTNVGINASTITYRLEVNSGTAQYLNARFYGSSHALLQIESTTAGFQSLISHKSPTREYSVGLQGDGTYSIYDNTANASRLILSTSGNLGLGVTPSAWGANFKALQIGNRAALSTDSGISTALTNNAFHNGTNFTYSQTATALLYRQEGGQHEWFNAPSGTAGNAISFTQAMTLGSNSGLSIGTPSAAPSQGLLVQGAANFNSSVTTATFLRASSGAQSNPAGGASVVIDYQSTSDLQGRIRSRDWDGAAWRNLTIEANNIILSPAGNVGIGTASPSTILDVRSVTPTLTLRDSRTSGTWSAGVELGKLDFFTSDITGIGAHSIASIGVVAGGANTASPDGVMVFSTGFYNEAPTEKMRITSTGNVLLTTTDSVIATNTSDGSDNKSINISGGGTQSIARGANLRLYGNEYTGEVGNAYLFSGNVANSNIVLNAYSSSSTIQFLSNNTERMRITASGRVLIGTPPPAESTFQLDVNGTGRFSGNTWMQSDLRFGADFAGSNTAIIKWQGSGASIANSLGLFTWADARDIQIGGKDVYFRSEAGTNRMVILAGGNVLIGTTTDNGSRLRVNGSVALPHVTKSANYTLDNTDYTVGFDCASNRTATLPDATTCAGRIYVIYQYNTNIGSRYVTLDGNGSQTINGLTTFSLQYYEDFTSVMIQSNGSNWVVIANSVVGAPI